MSNASAEMFKQLLEAKDMSFNILDKDGRVIETGGKLENTRIRVVIVFSEDNSDVSISATGFAEVPSDKVDKIINVCNDLNSHFRWVKFVYDKENEVLTAQDDALVQLDSVAEEVFELVMRMISIVDEAYPTIMRALWA